MEFLENLLSDNNLPIVSAFILGLITAISPCPLATNITATAYISKEISNKKQVFINGLLYTLGRIISYTVIGVIIYFGVNSFDVSHIFSKYGERFLGFLLVITGVFMLNIIPINIFGFGNISQKLAEKTNSKSYLGAILLGMIFALAFCPYSGIIYFGSLIPLTISTSNGLYLPIVFAIATGLPVIIIAYLLAFTVSGVGNFYNKIKNFQKYFSKVVAVIFILVGIYYILMFYFFN